MDDEQTLDGNGAAIFTPDARQGTVREMLARTPAAPAIVDPGVEESRRSATEAALATWRRETVLGQIITQPGHGFGFDTSDDEADPEFNPYTHYKRNEGDLKFLEHYIRGGAFERVNNERDFNRLVEAIRKSEDDLRMMETAGVGGTLMGMGLSMLDLTLLAPGGPLAKLGKGATRLGTAARFSGITAAQQAIVEGVLQQTDPARTALESFLNIGTAGVIGGGIGSLLHARIPGHPLHPDNPKNPLRPEVAGQDPIIFARPGETAEEATSVIRRDSVGAARVSMDDLAVADDNAAASMLSKVHKFAMGLVPEARAMHWTLPEARQAMFRLFNSANLPLRGDAKGIARGTTVEDIVRDFNHRAGNIIQDMRETFVRVNEALGASRLRTGAGLNISHLTAGRVDISQFPQSVFMDAIRRRQIAQQVAAEQNDPTVFSRFEKWFDETMRARGLSDDEVKLVRSEVEQMGGKIEGMFKTFEKEIVDAGLITPERAKGLGYGVPQIWNRHAVSKNPEKFKRYLYDLLVDSPDDEWLQATYGMDRAAFDKLGVGSRQRAEVLREWRGDQEVAELATAEAKYAASKAQYDQMVQFLAGVAQSLKFFDNAKGKATVASIKASARRAEAVWQEKRLAWALAKAEKAEARVETLRASYGDLDDLLDLGADVAADFAEKGSKLDEVGAALGAKLDTKAAAKAKVADLRKSAKELPPAEREALKAQIAQAVEERKGAVAEAKAATAEFRKYAKEARHSNKWLDAAAKRVDQQKDDLVKADELDGTRARLDDERARLNALKEAEADAVAARKQAIEDYRDVRRALTFGKSEVRTAKRGYRKATRALEKIKGRPAMSAYIDDLVEAMLNNERLPYGMIDHDAVTTTGRLKERHFKIPEQLRETMEKEGYLEADLPRLLESYTRGVGPHLAMRQVFGLDDPNGEKALQGILDGYNARIQDLVDAGKPRAAQALQAEREAVQKDFRGVRDRIFGRMPTPSSFDEFMTWGTSQLRALVHHRFVGGFSLGSIGDISTAMLRSTGNTKLGTGLLTHGAAVRRILHNASKEMKHEDLKRLLRSLEAQQHFSSHQALYGTNDFRMDLGVGPAGSFTRAATARIEHIMRSVSDRATVLSGMSTWNEMLKGVAKFEQLNTLRQWVGKYDELTPVQRADLATLGIDKRTAKRLGELFKKHGSEEDGIFYPQTGFWQRFEEDGAEMARVLRVALDRSANRAVYTPGYGSMPLMASGWFGRMVFQLQSYALKFTNDFMFGGAHRMLSQGDMRFANAMGVGLALGVVQTEIRAYIKGEDPRDWSTGKYLNEVISRAGLWGWMDPYFDSMGKLTGFHLMGEGTSKFAQNKWWESLLGPWLGTLSHTGALATAAANGDLDKVITKAETMFPLNQQFRLLRALGDDITE